MFRTADPTPSLPYARPTTHQRVMRELAAADTLGAAAVATKFAIGVPLCLIGPAFVTLIAKSIEFRWQSEALPGFFVTFCLVALVLVPIMFWFERRTAGEFFTDAAAGESTDRPASYGEFEMNRTKMLWTAYVEIALTGPRLVWAAADALRGRARVDPAGKGLAAEIVVDLFDAGQGVPTKSLFKPGRPQKDVVAAVEYLAGRDWVGLSKTRDRIWLSSPARKKLNGR